MTENCLTANGGKTPDCNETVQSLKKNYYQLHYCFLTAYQYMVLSKMRLGSFLNKRFIVFMFMIYTFVNFVFYYKYNKVKVSLLSYVNKIPVYD